MDPAGPYFDSLPREVRLDQSDAQFVDVIHTNAKSVLQFGFGTTEPSGHVDFYPNGGKNQPHCSDQRKLQEFSVDSLMNGVSNFAFCDHRQSVQFYIEAIRNTRCTPIAYTCKDYDTYLTGTCSDANGQYAVLGPKAELFKDLLMSSNDNDSVKLYLKMGSDDYKHCCKFAFFKC